MDDPRDDELLRLRRCLRDVLAFTALPSVWTGYDPVQIAIQLGDVIGRTLFADAVYVRASNHEHTWVAPGCAPEVVEALRLECSISRGGDASAVSEGGEVRLLASGLALGANDRIIVAARRPDFPDENDRLLLRVAANQASTWIQRKLAERAFADEVAFRHGIESSMAAGVTAVDLNGCQTYVNPSFAAMVGWDASELVGAVAPFLYWAPEDEPHTAAALQQVIDGNLPAAGFDLRFRRRNEERFDALVLVSPLEQDGVTTGYIGCVYDVTERRTNERSSAMLAEASAILGRSLNYEETLTSLAEFAVPRIADWCFVDLAEKGGWFRRIAAAHADPMDAELATRFKRRYAPNPAAAGVSRSFASGHPVVMNDVAGGFLDAIARDPHHREALAQLDMRCFVSVPMVSRGATFGVITFVGTRTRVRFEQTEIGFLEELGRRAAVAVDNARLFTEAVEASRAKDEFLANMSHELRTPMTAILGWAHLLQTSDLPAEDIRLGIGTIRQSAQAQAKLIDDLLDVSRVIAGKLHLNLNAVDAAVIAEEAVATVRPSAMARRQNLTLEIHEAPLTVMADASRLQQVFWNLLSNAVKFTPVGGSVSMTVDRHGHEVVVQVADDGEGISAEYLPQVFDRFRQLGKGHQSGLGIGLAIARELVEMHGGSIRAESEGEGRGTTFTVILPASVVDMKSHEARRQRDHLRLRDVRVLLVEDDDTTRTLLTTLLRTFGGAVCAARSAAEALALAITFKPQVVISDIAMPGDDGVLLLEKLRANGYAGPAIAVTAYADRGNRERVMTGGFEAFVSKPIDPGGLALVVERALRGEAATVPGE